MTQQADVIVVGSGATGSWAAKILTESGARVLLLEAGRAVLPAFEPDSPGAIGAPEPKVSSDRARQHIQSRCYAYGEATQHLFVDDLDCPYETPAGSPFTWIRSRTVGGRMRLWARVALRMSDRQFKAASIDGFGADWPIGYRDLQPHYDEVETVLGVSGMAGNFAEIADGHYVPTNLGGAATEFRSKMQSRWPQRQLTALRQVIRPGARNMEEAGRTNDASIICDVVDGILGAARRTGRLTLRSDAIVSRVITDDAGTRAHGVEFVDAATNERHEASAPVVLLCASTIETTRILLNSKSHAHPDGVGNGHGMLGRFLTEHVSGVCVVGQRKGAVTGKDEIYIPNFRNLMDRERGFVRGYGVQGYIAPLGGNSTVCTLFCFGEMLPRLHNRVVLSNTLRDRWGIPVPRICCEFSENETQMARDQAEQLRQMLAQAGYDLVHATECNPPGTSIHEAGTARMGADPRTSVLNPNNQLWQVPNLFVADGAAFPSVGFQNPTLTMMAVTGRACQVILDQLKR